ncbi:hypothetical protein ACNSTU_11285 [Aquisalimonas sp. APHAB1-3]|uniref:hypothetical protein n=1 Tax=Aquisalimonas sp. APHAB1-3 TaxID=3402080 RepID=UPI003AB05F24
MTRSVMALGCERAVCSAMAFAAATLFSAAVGADSLTDIVESMEPGEWRELPDTRLKDVFPERDAHPNWGNQGPQAVTRAWSGAAYDTKRNRLIVTGGGHGAYGGNEVYEFDLEAIEWRRVTEPSAHEVDPAFEDQNDPSQYLRTVDDTPVSRHTYDSLIYLPNVDKVFLWGGSLYSVGRAYDRHAWLYDPEDGTWTRGAESSGENIHSLSGYDPETGQVVVEHGRGLYGYDPVNDHWETVSGGTNGAQGRVAEFDPERRLLIQAFVPYGNRGPIAVFDLNQPGQGRNHPDISGNTDFADTPAPGMAYHPPTGYMVLWNGWRATWVLDPDTWAAHKVENLPSRAPDHYGTDRYPVRGQYKTWGIYGRWAYVPDYDVFIGYGHVDDNVWLYRLPEDPFNWTVPADHQARECPGDLCVGPDFELNTPSQAASRAQDGDTVYIQEGEYEDCARWRTSVTIRGLDGRPKIGDKVCHGKAVWIVQGDVTVIENVELHGGYGPGRHGESIRHEGKRLTVRDTVVHGSRMGILTGHDSDKELEVYNSEFYGIRSATGLAHHIYAGRIGRFVAEGNYLHDDSVGHRLKSVAAENRIRYNLASNPGSASASLIDVWGCSDTEIVGNVLVYGGTDGALQAISMTHRNQRGERLSCEREASARIAYNSAAFLPENSRWSSFVRNHFGVEYEVTNNIAVNTRDLEFEGSETGLGRLAGNVHQGHDYLDYFVDPQQGDLRLKQPLGDAVNESVRPERAYQHPMSTVARESFSSPGAYEYEPD